MHGAPHVQRAPHHFFPTTHERAARAAALHLGWLAAGEDEAGEPGALRAWLRELPDAPPLADVEAALERLGAAACLREAVARCPLQARCPLRMSSTGTG